MSHHRNATPASGLGSTNNSYAAAVLEYVEQQGHDPAEVFDAACIRQICQNPEGERIPVGQWRAMLQRACQYLKDPAFPLKLAATIKPRHLGMLGYLLMSCDTLASAVLTLQRYEALLDSVNEARFNVEGQSATVTWLPLIHSPPAEFIMLSMALWAHHARWLTECPDLVCDVRFSFAAPHDPAVRACFDAVFGGRVLFDQCINVMTVPIHYLSLPVVQRDRHVHELLRQRADADLQGLSGSARGFVDHLETLIVDRLEHGAVSLLEVAKALEMAPRTVQSRLDRIGVTYRQVLDRVRLRQAEVYLRDPDMSLAEVTVVLGFTQQSAFHHAFKRWTGASPGHYRRSRL